MRRMALLEGREAMRSIISEGADIFAGLLVLVLCCVIGSWWDGLLLVFGSGRRWAGLSWSQ
jgi:hypothetical protein